MAERSLPLSDLAPGARAARRLGVLGGSFDPPHRGHLHAARQARAAFALDHVVFVPAARPPHKPERALVDAGERVEMLARLLAEEPASSIWGIELGRPGPSYTLETLRALQAGLDPAVRLFLIFGEDNLGGFPGWRGVEDIVRLAQPVVVRRTGGEERGKGPPREIERLSDFARTRLRIGTLAGPTVEVSSTELRARLGRGQACPELIPASVREYVGAHGLYAAR